MSDTVYFNGKETFKYLGPLKDVPFVFQQVQMDVDVRFVQDQLKGDNITEIRLKFIKRLEDAIPVGED